MGLLEFIAENTYQYYLAQNTDTTYTKSLQKALDETDRAINNLLRAIEAGIFNESTKDPVKQQILYRIFALSAVFLNLHGCTLSRGMI